MEEIKFALDTFYAVMAGALVMWMAAGFTMLEAGLVQKKDVSEIVTKNLGLYSIACIMYLVCGFMLMYPGGALWDGVIPSIGTSLGLSTGLPNEEIGMPYSMDYSQQADFFFQVVFVATAMSIVSGAVAGRMKLIPFFLFAIILTGFIYPIQMSWEWGGGWLDSLGFADFAGSTLVHACGGAAALAGVMILGPRLGRFTDDGSPQNMAPFAASSIPLVTLGTFILWMGWYGFNGGSQLALGSFEDSTAMSKIFMNTQLAACGGCIAGAVITRILGGKTDIIMMLNGALAGLVSITAEPLMPSPLLSIVIGAIGGVIMYFGTNFLEKMKLDDVVGAIPVHMFAGIFGTLVVPISNPDTSFVIQLLGVGSVCIFVFVVSYICISIIKSTIGLRISDEAEKLGTDKAEVGVMAYSIRD